MPAISPTFDGNYIFDSISALDGTTFSEGLLTVEGYTKIRQRLHFNGELGDRYLTHGYPDRHWRFEGLLSAGDYDSLAALIRQIEAYIDAADASQATYSTMTDSFANAYTYAQIHSFNYVEPPRARDDGGYVCAIRVEGIIQGMEQEG